LSDRIINLKRGKREHKWVPLRLYGEKKGGEVRAAEASSCLDGKEGGRTVPRHRHAAEKGGEKEKKEKKNPPQLYTQRVSPIKKRATPVDSGEQGRGICV